MGYASYELPDGRRAGYAESGVCSYEGCSAPINMGIEQVCGDFPWHTRKDPSEPGCGEFFCSEHDEDHGCSNDPEMDLHVESLTYPGECDWCSEPFPCGEAQARDMMRADIAEV